MPDMVVLEPRRAFSTPAGTTARGQTAVLHALVLAGCASTLAGTLLLSPSDEGLSLFGYRWPLRCWLHEITGIECALCGLSRSFCSLARGDIAAGVHFHRVGPAVFVLVCLEIPYRLYALAKERRAINAKLARLHLRVAVLVCAAIAVNWMVYLGGLTL